MSEEEREGPRCVFAGVEVPFKAVNFADKHEARSLKDGDMEPILTSIWHPQIGPPAGDSFWKWMTSVHEEERMRQAVDEAIGREGPITITERLEKEGIVKEYLGGYCKSIEWCGDKLSLQTTFQTVQTWLVSERSKGWVCLDDECVVEL